MAIERHEIDVTVAAGGGAEVVSIPMSGKILVVRYVKDDFASGTNFVITTDKLGIDVWTEASISASQTVAPRMPTCDYLAAPSLYTVIGESKDEPVEDYIPLANESIKIVIDTAGTSTSGRFIVVVEH